MTNKDQAPRSEGTVSESNDWVSGEGGPNMTQGGATPGGSEMEGWKKVNSNDPDGDLQLEEEAENLRQRVNNS